MGLLETLQFQPLDVITLRGKLYNPFTWVIFPRTSSRWTHCVMVRSVIKDLTIYNPVMNGVGIDPLIMYRGRYAAVLREHVPLTNIQKISMITWADQKAKRSKCYDLLAIAGFITGWKELQDEDAWYCSEFSYWCREEAGFHLFNEQLVFIYPSDIYRCSYFKVVAEGKL